jgi:hypothetical protein
MNSNVFCPLALRRRGSIGRNPQCIECRQGRVHPALFGVTPPIVQRKTVPSLAVGGMQTMSVGGRVRMRRIFILHAAMQRQ